MGIHRNMKTEHNGAKHAKGFWGTKIEAKTNSKKKRRNDGKKVVLKAQDIE